MDNWNRQSISKKLGALVGLMILLVIIQLSALLFTLNTMTGLRSFVRFEGESLESQRSAIHSLQLYALTDNPEYLDQFQVQMEVWRQHHKLRQELISDSPKDRFEAQDFTYTEIQPSEFSSLMRLFQNFSSLNFTKPIVAGWEEHDRLMDELQKEANQLTEQLRLPIEGNSEVFARIQQIQQELEVVEDRFNEAVAKGASWIEKVFLFFLIGLTTTGSAVALIGITIFTRNFKSRLKELTAIAKGVGAGKFNKMAKIRSKDEIGELAVAINDMNRKLKKSFGERRKAETADKVKSAFLANMSHEIRTPLGVMLGLTEILKDDKLTYSQRQEYIEIIERNGKGLTQVIHDILDLSKTENNELDNSTFSLPELMEEIESMLKLQARVRNNTLEFQTSGNHLIVTDRVKLYQLLINTLSNTLKFTEDSKVTIEYSFTEPNLCFFIKGIGTSYSRNTSLQQAFNETRFSHPRLVTSTNLGLVLAQRLAQNLGGEISYQPKGKSRSGKVNIQIKAAAVVDTKRKKNSKDKSALTQGSGFPGKKILLVDDSEESQFVIRLFLKRWGVSLDWAHDGRQGLEKVTANKDYDLILMDIEMPRMDGHTATKRLREAGYTKPIIALTAHALKEDKLRSLASGSDDYLTKPLDSTVLYECLRKYFKTSDSQATDQDLGPTDKNTYTSELK